MDSKTQSHIDDNKRRIKMYVEMLIIAKKHCDQYEVERIERAIAEWNEDTQYLLNGGKR